MVKTLWLQGCHCGILNRGGGGWFNGELKISLCKGGGLRITIWGGERFRTLLGKFYSPIIDSPELPQMSKKGLSLGTHATQTQVIHTDINKHKMPCVLAKILLGFFTSFKRHFYPSEALGQKSSGFCQPFFSYFKILGIFFFSVSLC